MKRKESNPNPVLMRKSSGVLAASEEESDTRERLGTRILPAKGYFLLGVFWIDLAQLDKEHGGIPVLKVTWLAENRVRGFLLASASFSSSFSCVGI